jgi:NAD(P)-dependent dehydrogenase (short-subunit alcohol dehydrogenase family)
MTAEAWGLDKKVLDISLDTWDRTMSVNLRSTFAASQAALPHLIARGGGSIINMGSAAGANGASSLVAYGTSKAAIAVFTKYLAVQYGRDNVRSNCIIPGVIQSEQLLKALPDGGESLVANVAFPRIGQPADVANLVAYLVSKDAEFLNGEMIHCDGGASAGRLRIQRDQ